MVQTLVGSGAMDSRSLTVTSLESTSVSSEFARVAPGPRLEGSVRSFIGYRERSDAPLRRRTTAMATVPLVLSFGDRMEVLELGHRPAVDSTFVSFTSGLLPGHTVTRFQGTQFGIQLDLTPLGAHRLFGLPGADLAGRAVPLDEVAPHLAGSLPDRLASAPSWEQRLTVLGEVVAEAIDRGRQPDPLVAWVWEQLEQSRGQMRITELVRRSGWSHRYLAKRFREQVGVTPKVAARVLRFESALAGVTAGRPLAAVAAECGYADQSHLSREFAELGGCTPTAMQAPDTACGAVRTPNQVRWRPPSAA